MYLSGLFDAVLDKEKNGIPLETEIPFVQALKQGEQLKTLGKLYN
jgi:hypothetical protein